MATALVALGLTAPASAEDGAATDTGVTVESTTELVVAMEPAPEVETALPPEEPVAEAPTPEEPPATADPVQTEPVQTAPVEAEPAVADPPLTESGGTSSTTTPVDPATVAGTDPVAAAEGDVTPSETAGLSMQTQVTPATGATGDAGLTSPAAEEGFDGQGTGEDVPVLESLPLPTAPSPGPSTPGAVTLPAPLSIAVAATGWTNPAIGRLTSAFGLRVHPVLGTFGAHAGQDIATRCGSPVYAAASGAVIWAGGALQGRTGNQVVIAHGDGVITRYGHLLTGTLLVKQGDTVQAGQRVASVGGDRSLDPFGAGNSTGCHLHFEVNLSSGATPVDPLAFLLARGVRLGSDEPVVVVAPVDVAGVIVAPAQTVATVPVLDRAALEALMGPWLPVVAIRAVG